MSATIASPLLVASPTPPGPEVNPWKGLHFYTEMDRAIFFGRDQETEEFVRLVQRDTLSVLFARSGFGKTSLLRAGVVPRLREEGLLPVMVRVDYAASAPTPARQIADAALAAAAAAGIDATQTVESVTGSVPEVVSETLWEFFHRCEFWGPRNDLVVPVLILDQFEEAFTLGREGPHTVEFLAQLADLAENRMPQSVQRRIEASGERPAFDTRAQNYRVVLSLREDYVPKLDSLRPIMPAVMRNRFALAPMDEERGVEVIRRAGGRWVSDTVAREIVAAVAGETQTPEQQAQAYAPDAEIEPAYLSVMCHELFRRMTELGRSEIGSDLVATEHGNILDGLYERSFEGLDPRTRLFVEDRLLTASGFRGTVPLAEAWREDVPIIDLESLVDRRLLRFEDRLGTTHVELSHDRLTDVVQKSRDRRRAEAAREAERKREAGLRAQLRRSRRQAWAGAVNVFLLLGAIGFYAYGWIIPYHSYCRHFTKRWGMLHPVGALPASAVAHRSWTLKLTRPGRFRDVQTAEVIDANGELTGQHPISTHLADSDPAQTWREKESRYEFVYDGHGRVVYEVAWDRFGRMTWGFAYAPHTETASDRPMPAKATFLGPDAYPLPQGKSRAEFVEITYDAKGFEFEHRFTDREGNPAPGKDDAYGRRMEYDPEGRLVRLTSLNEHRQPTNDAAGNAGFELEYDEDGNETETRAFDAKGEPTLVAGYYRVKREYDEWGRNKERRCFNLSGERTTETDETGAHLVKWEYDDRGNVTSTKLYDTLDRPIVAGEKFFAFAAHEKRATFDEQNRLETVTYFDPDGKPLTGPEGWHSYRFEYETSGVVSATGYFDGDGHPVQLKTSGVHRKELVKDRLGQPVETRFFDAERKPVSTRDGGYHLRKNEYDKFGNSRVGTFFGVDGKPVADRTIGAHRVIASFDRFRHPTRVEIFDAADQATNNIQGFHRVEAKYDDYGSELERRWYDKDGRPCNGPNGIHRVSYEYDNRGLPTRAARYDADDRPAIGKDDIHETLTDYNGKRQQTRWQAFGLNGKPAEDDQGNHLIRSEFDEKGRQTKFTRLRADGSPNLDRELRIATTTVVYDREGKPIETAYHDQDGGLGIGLLGFAKLSNVIEPDGRIAVVYYGTDGKPMFNPLVGYAIAKRDPRKRGDTTESYHGPDGALITGPEGYAEVRRRWGDDGTPLSEAFFGPDGAPVAGLGGHHRAERLGNSGTTRYFDAEDRELPALDPDAFVAVILIAEITDIKQPAVKAGVRAGDILWAYGNWSFPESLEVERAKGIESSGILDAVRRAFFAERDRLSAEQVPMTVIRNGKPVTVSIPPLPAKTIGARLQDRTIPIATFEEWKAVAAKRRTAFGAPTSSEASITPYPDDYGPSAREQEMEAERRHGLCLGERQQL